MVRNSTRKNELVIYLMMISVQHKFQVDGWRCMDLEAAVPLLRFPAGG